MLDDAIQDIHAVMDAADSKQATLFRVAVGAGICTAFALRHPERTRSLILWDAHARLLATPGYPAGWSEAFFTSVLEGVERDWATGSGIEAMNPSLAEDERYRSWFVRHARAAASPAQARELFHLCAHSDLRRMLAEPHTPTLLLHRTGDPWLSVEHSRHVAERITDAKLVELPGVDHWPWIGDMDTVLAEVQEFLTGVRPSRRDRPAWGPDALTRREREVAALAVQPVPARGCPPSKDAPAEQLALYEAARNKQSSRRICVEHAIAEPKQWRSLQRWSGRREYYAETHLAVAGLVSDRAARR